MRPNEVSDDPAERLQNCLAFLNERGSIAISPELARLVAVGDGVLVLDLLDRDRGESLASATLGAALDEHRVEKVQEPLQLWPRAGDVVVVHVEHAEELHTRLAVISCHSGHHRVGPLLHGVQRFLGSFAHRRIEPQIVRLDHQNLRDCSEQADGSPIVTGTNRTPRLPRDEAAAASRPWTALNSRKEYPERRGIGEVVTLGNSETEQSELSCSKSDQKCFARCNTAISALPLFHPLTYRSCIPSSSSKREQQ